MSELPLGWINVSWVEITTQDGFRRGPFGGNLKKEVFVKKGYSVYEQYAPINDDCKKFRYFITEEKYQELSSFWVEEGDFLISCSGTMGKITQVPIGSPKGVINQALLRVRLINSVVYSSFFIKLFRSPAIQERVLTKSGGGAIQNLAAVNQLKEIKVPIPPLNEQKRIADKLDAVLARVDACRDRLDSIPTILKRFRQSVLSEAVNGKLTSEWREKNQKFFDINQLFTLVTEERNQRNFRTPNGVLEIDEDDMPFEIPENWKWVRLGSVSLKITDGAHNTPKALNSGFPYLMARDITAGSLDFTGNRFISEKEHRELYNKCQPENGDLLVVNIGAGTGNNVLVDVDFEFSFKNLAIIKRPKFIHPKYLKWFFDSQKQKIFNEQTRGGAQPFLSLNLLNNLSFALPPIDEQIEIVRRVESLFAYADRLEARYNAARAQVDKLIPALLAKAFRGELVPQDPNDEPASELLARIAAAQSTDKVKKTRKPTSGKNARVSS